MSDAGARTAYADDVPEVGRIQAAVWRAAYTDVLDPDVVDRFAPDAFAAVWRQSLSSPPTAQHRLLVATEGSDVVGFAAIGPAADADLTSSTAATGEILALGIDPAHRRVGHGSRLLNAAVDTLRAGGFGAVTAWLLAQDEQLRAFTAAAGLHPDGAHRDRVISADGRTTREVRLRASLLDTDD